MSKRAHSPSAGPARVIKKGRTISTFAPKKIASAEDARKVLADPPLSKLVRAVKEAIKNPPRGCSVVYWMRMNDLRICDNRALAQASAQAVADNIPLIVLFVLSPQDYVAHDRSKRKVDFTLRNLSIIKSSLASLDIPLYTTSHAPRRSIPEKIISILRSFEATRLFANIEYEVDELRRDIKICELAKENNIRPTFVHDKCIIEPGVLQTKGGKSYTVYSPYQRNWITTLNNTLSRYIDTYPAPDPNFASVHQHPTFGPLFDVAVPRSVDGFELEDANKETIRRVWPAGTDVAIEILSRFLRTKSRESQIGASDPLAPGAEVSEKINRIAAYNDARDRADRDTTSRISPYLSSGVISARECVRACMKLLGIRKVEAGNTTGVGKWVQELAWRDFYNDVLASYPHVSMGRPFQEKMANVKWEVNEEHLNAWKEGRTGVPIVDAAMNQLNTMGWMHNRMRMIVAMFLSKDLMLDWHLGERYFMEQLIDGDFASNNGGWQWSASSGVDAAPYFRLFNPYSQSIKADPRGDYIRHFVEELRDLRGPEVHNPSAKVADKLGYPKPIVRHEEVRERALRRYKNPGQK